jgi:dihydroxyacid dehydratase/phosphogluconate dehydratase
VFEAVGQFASNTISEIELENIEKTAIPGPGSCGGMYTANTMASAIEALGMSLPNSSAQDAISAGRVPPISTSSLIIYLPEGLRSAITGTLAPMRVKKITGKEGLSFKGRAKCFGREEAALEAILKDKIQAGDVIVIRYEGPAG